LYSIEANHNKDYSVVNTFTVVPAKAGIIVFANKNCCIVLSQNLKPLQIYS